MKYIKTVGTIVKKITYPALFRSKVVAGELIISENNDTYCFSKNNIIKMKINAVSDVILSFRCFSLNV
ncbi:MAG: hypothetical protein ABSE13_11935 [Methanoregula sp.]|jgi:hypothetical protein